MKKHLLTSIAIIFTVHFLFGILPSASAQLGGGRSGNSRIEEPEYEYPSGLDIPKGRRPRVQAEERVIALKRFSLELYRQLIEDESKKNRNVVCSPWSIAVVLSMLLEGADAETKKELRKALHIQGPPKFFEKYLFMLAFNARAKKKHQFMIAPLILETVNSFWRQSGYEFREEYVDLLSQRFMAECFDVEFNSQAVKEINEWCSEKTRQEIKEIVTADDMTPERRMIILNAVYFKARWEKVFDIYSTKPEWFHHADGSVSKTPMMNKKETYFQYCESTGFKVLRKDYCGNAHMLILLSDEVDDLPELENKLTPKLLRQIDDQLKTELVNVKLPRFSLEYGEDLISILKRMGVESAFNSNEANFSKMTDEKNFYIDILRQKAIIEVDEEGTTAAAVTGGMGAGGMPPKVYSFYADRPFLFLIRENTDGGILFIGRVHHPETIGDE